MSELQSLNKIMNALQDLDMLQRRRIIVYLNDWFNAEVAALEAAQKAQAEAAPAEAKAAP